MMHPIPPAICFGCEQINVVAGLSDTPAPGDYDGNLAVEIADYDGWKTHFGDERAVLQGIRHRFDGNADGTVNAADYTIWRDRLGQADGGSTLAAVPEPCTALLAASALALLGPRQRN